MFSHKNKKKGFTLIEMLIVIVIIGILMAALIPRLTGARGRANDVARRADLAQIASALVSYQIDKGTFPSEKGSVNCISWYLISAWMSWIPKDPNTSRAIAWFSNPTAGCTIAGNYYYFPVQKNWIANGGFGLVAATETEWGSNFSTKPGDIDMSSATVASYENLSTRICTTFTEWWASTCWYIKTSDQLRYMYLY